jgi:G3E family GTPase
MRSSRAAPRSSPIPVTVLTGALGAGKTTILNSALKTGALVRTAVIVNEFGAVGIDHALIQAASEEVVLLPGGCLCCQVRADLAVALLRLERSASLGEMHAFERAVIETSGLAEPGPILQLFVESAALAGRYRVEAVVTVVDALLGMAALDSESPAYRQVLLADRLLISKSERVQPAALGALDAKLVRINPYAERVRAGMDGARAAWFGPAALQGGRRMPGGAYRATHDDAVGSFVIQWDQPQPLSAVGAWLHAIAENFGSRLLRVKGIIAVPGEPQAVAVHAVQHVVEVPQTLSLSAGSSRVVFITRGLEPEDVEPEWQTSLELMPSEVRSGGPVVG